MRSAWVVRIGQRLTKQRLLGQEAGVGEGVGERTKDARSIAFNLYSLPVKANKAPRVVVLHCSARLYATTLLRSKISQYRFIQQDLRIWLQTALETQAILC